MPGSSGRIDAPNINAYVVGSSGGGSVDAAPAAAPAPKAEAREAFDPGDHTVAEVEAYLADHPDETAAVLKAEKAGKNRQTLVGD